MARQKEGEMGATISWLTLPVQGVGNFNIARSIKKKLVLRGLLKK